MKLEVGRKEAPTLQFLTMKDKDPKDISDLLSDLKIKDNENNLGKYTIKKLDVKVDIKILYISIVLKRHVSPKKRNIFIFELLLVNVPLKVV